MELSRRRFLQATTAFAVLGEWHRPCWASAPVWVPPATREIRAIENVWIRLKDGTRLSARLFVPKDARRRPVGAILDYMPYRKRTSRMRLADERAASWLVPRGFAYVRVDIRGTGESDGVITNEYDPAEQRDVVEVVRWLAAQPWCNGRVGMRGLSYSAITAIQAASRSLPELVAVLAAAGTDNGYFDDVHTLGGCLITDKAGWAAIWKTVMTAPPDPELVGARWRSMWQERLEAQIPLAAEWHRHLLIDEYWRARSLQDATTVRCGMYLVAGASDVYVNFVPRLLERLHCPRKGLIGTWSHGYPDRGAPGPMLDWAVEESRWWDYWLNQHDNGIMSEPMLRSYMAHTAVAQTGGADIPGRWVAEPTWPPPGRERARKYPAADGTLAEKAASGGRAPLSRWLTVGTCIPSTSPRDPPNDTPQEQSLDDSLSTVFDTAPLPGEVELLGNPLLRLRFASDRPVSKLAARLVEVTADGKSWLLCYGAANLSHDAGHSAFVPIQAGEAREAVLQFSFVSRRLNAGSRLRLSVSQAQWPVVWPAPERVGILLDCPGCVLELPVRPRPANEATMPIPLVHDPGRTARQPIPMVQVEGDGSERRVSARVDVPEEMWTLDAIDMKLGSQLSAGLSMAEADPLSNRVQVRATEKFERPGWRVAIVAEVSLTSTAADFVVDESLEARLNDEVVFTRRWQNQVPRNGN